MARKLALERVRRILMELCVLAGEPDVERVGLGSFVVAGDMDLLRMWGQKGRFRAKKLEISILYL